MSELSEAVVALIILSLVAITGWFLLDFLMKLLILVYGGGE